MYWIRISAETSVIITQSVQANTYVELDVLSLVSSVAELLLVSAHRHDRCLVTAFSRRNTQLLFPLFPPLLCSEKSAVTEWLEPLQR
jgi:hypothetical protein